jgi:UDP-N-acetylmuramate dehydrogenase
MVLPATATEVQRTVRLANEHGIAYAAVGKGSNLIVRDRGYDGIVIKLAEHMTEVRLTPRTVVAEGGASFAALARKLTKAGRTGLEFGIGIPGSVGGAVHMNAGAFGGEVSEALVSARIVAADGGGRDRCARALSRSRTGTRASTRAQSWCPRRSTAAPGTVRKDVYEPLHRPQENAADLGAAASAAPFVNPPGTSRPELIEGCGLKGPQHGRCHDSRTCMRIHHQHRRQRACGRRGSADRPSSHRGEERYGVELKTEVVVIGDR